MAGKGAEVRTSHRFRQDIEDGEEQRSDLQGETDDPDSAEQQREQGELEAIRDFWIKSGSFISRDNVQDGQKIVCATEKLVSDPLKYIWCGQVDTRYIWDVLQEFQIDYWIFNGWSGTTIRAMDPFHTVHRIEYNSTWRIHVVRREIDEDSDKFQSRRHMARNLIKYVRERSAKRKTALAEENPKFDTKDI